MVRESSAELSPIDHCLAAHPRGPSGRALLGITRLPRPVPSVSRGETGRESTLNVRTADFFAALLHYVWSHGGWNKFHLAFRTLD